MTGKGGSSLGTLLFSIPLAAIPLMAIFGIPQFAPLVASPERAEGHERGFDDERLDDRYPEERTGRRRTADLIRSRGFETDLDQGGASEELADRRASQAPLIDERSGELPRRQGRQLDRRFQGRTTDLRGGEFEADPPGDDAPPFRSELPPPGASAAGSNEPPSARSVEAPAAGSALTWQSAAQRFEALGINSYHLEPGSEQGSFLFVCSFCPESSPNVTMRFEAEAAEPLAAVDDVLAQIDRWHEQQSTIDDAR